MLFRKGGGGSNGHSPAEFPFGRPHKEALTASKPQWRQHTSVGEVRMALAAATGPDETLDLRAVRREILVRMRPVDADAVQSRLLRRQLRRSSAPDCADAHLDELLVLWRREWILDIIRNPLAANL